jgi:hypothetical protein
VEHSDSVYKKHNGGVGQGASALPYHERKAVKIERSVTQTLLRHTLLKLSFLLHVDSISHKESKVRF